MLSTERRGLDGVEYGPLPARVGRRTESLALLMAVLSFPKNNVMGNRRAPTRYTPPTPTYRKGPVIVIGDFSSIVCRSLNTLLLLPPTAPLPMSSFGVKMLALE